MFYSGKRQILNEVKMTIVGFEVDRAAGFLTSWAVALCILSVGAGYAADFSAVPGSVIGYRAASTNQFLSSPSITILPNGDYLASHDLFGPGFSEETSGLTTVYRSTNKGETWSRIAEVTNMHFSSLFVHENDVYLIGSRHEAGDYLIRKSTNGGVNWTTPVDSQTGLLLPGSYGGTSHNVVVHDGRIWAMAHTQASPKAVSAPVGSDLLNAASWTLSNHIPRNNSWLDDYPYADFQRWTESQPVASPQDGVMYLPKLTDARYTALIKADSTTGNVSFDPDHDFAFLPGAEKKFGVSYDPVTQRYWAATNPVLEEHDDDHPSIGDATRNTAALFSSPDLRDWKLESVFLYHPDSLKHAFQYLNFEFDGNDLAVVARTAFDDGVGGAKSYHDNNLMTFHRVEDFRNLSPTHVLVADTNNNRVVRYQTLDNMPWAPLENFADGVYEGASLDKPFGLAQTSNGDVYIGEQKVGGRILRFDAAGNFLEIVAQEGIQFTGNPEALVVGQDDRLYLSVAFGGTNSDRIYRLDPQNQDVSLFVDKTFDDGKRTFDNPRGMAFDDQGNLYVADRDGTDSGSPAHNLVRKFDGATGEFIQNLKVVNKPMGLYWDSEQSRLILSADSPVDILSLNSNGVSTALYTQQDDLGLPLGLAVIDGAVTWTDFSNGRIDQLTGLEQRQTVVSGLNGPGHLLEVDQPNQRTWISSADGRWKEGQNWNWLWGIANQADEIAVLNASGGGQVDIEISDPTTVGGMRFLGNASHTIYGQASLTVAASPSGNAIEVFGGQHAIENELLLANNTSIHLKEGTNLTIREVSSAGDQLVLKGGGELVLQEQVSFANPELGELVLTQATILSGSGHIDGHVLNPSGILARKAQDETLVIGGNYIQSPVGVYEYEISTSTPPQTLGVEVLGSVSIAGELIVKSSELQALSLSVGDSFDLINSASGIEGMFSQWSLPSLSAGQDWAIQLQDHTLRLFVTGAVLEGDFDGDGDVDGRDFLVWQSNPAVGSLLAWQNHYNSWLVPSTSTTLTVIPEPSGIALSLLLVGQAFVTRREMFVRFCPSRKLLSNQT